MSYAVVNLLLTVIDLYWWVVIVSVILSWLVAFDVLNTRSQAAQTIWRAVDSLTEPLLRPIRSVLPAVGGLDLSPLLLLLGLQFLRDLIARSAMGGFALG
jgi:YggT family protein